MKPFDELFYTPVKINNTFQVQGMLLVGNEEAELEMFSENILLAPIPLT